MFIIRSTWRCASKRDGKQARQQQPSIRWAQRVPKGGLGSILRATTRQEEVDAMGLLLSAVVPTVTAPSSCCDGRDDCFHSSNALLMADMPEARSARRLRTQAVAHRQAFRCCRLRGLAQTLGSSNKLFAWISRNRRLARDFERYATTVVAFVRLIRIMLRRLATNTPL